jgi:hypothetical protein
MRQLWTRGEYGQAGLTVQNVIVKFEKNLKSELLQLPTKIK